jgi:hypothetical protein
VCSVARKLLYCDLCCVWRCDMLHCMSSWGGSGVCVCIYVSVCACVYSCVCVAWYCDVVLLVISHHNTIFPSL